jgi:beta-galactosidase
VKDSPLKRNIDFNQGWEFVRKDVPGAHSQNLRSDGWDKVILPHTANVEPLVVNNQWQGICWYRKWFTVDKSVTDHKVFIEFEAAMQIADVWINGKHKTTHYGGYLPFTVDVTDDLISGNLNLVAVRLDNRDNTEVPPGKVLDELDFNMYSGLYRNVKMHITDRLHITDALFANKTASGGVFISYPKVTQESATVQVETHVINEYSSNKRFFLMTKIVDLSGKIVKADNSELVEIQAGQDRVFAQSLEVEEPTLWSPRNPNLYTVRSIVMEDNKAVDAQEVRIGIRHISFNASGGFKINGERFYLRGANRHQEYPYIGYALSDNAHYRDVVKIKEAGFDFIRLSHYPHSPEFLDACDELGIVAINCIPGWQFFGNETFQQRSLQDCRDMIRRDRNHPCVILWEVSLNETGSMTDKYMAEAHQIAHEEYPGDQCFTCSYIDKHYDVFTPARQHATTSRYWKDYEKGDKALVIAEYGDWEYYADNAGFDQTAWKNLLPEERSSRQLRKHGEIRLLQQALNFQEAHNDNLDSPTAGDCLWVMFDYNRGYSEDIEASGPMDIFRLPKFGYYFFQSQRDADEIYKNAKSGPMVYIANYWTKDSPTDIRVFSNCQEVALYLNDKLVEKRKPDKDRLNQNLRHGSFTFDVRKFQPGVLKAVGIIDEKECVSYEVRTPGATKTIKLNCDLSGRKLKANGNDVIFVYASTVDEKGTVIPDADNTITFSVSGPGELIGQNPIQAEAGIIGILLRASISPGLIEVYASAPSLKTTNIKIKSY